MVKSIALMLLALVVSPGPTTAQRPWDGIAADAPEGVYVRVREQFYDVAGAEPEALAEDLRRQAVEAWGQPALAATIGNIRWPYRFARQGEMCALSNVGVRLDATVRMPRWSGRATAAPDEQHAWDRFLHDLREHEMGHIRLYLDASGAVIDEMRELGPVACVELGERVDEAANSALVRFHERHTAFDRDPESPRATWPPVAAEDAAKAPARRRPPGT